MQGAVTLQASSSLSSDSRTCSTSPFPDAVASTCSLGSFALKGQSQFASVKTCSLYGKCVENLALGRTERPSRITVARAEASNDGSSKPVAPLQAVSPSGQLLEQLLRSHPHLVPAAAEQQLEKLSEDRDAASGSKQPSTTASDLVLYRRILKLRAKERCRAVEEIIYALIVEKFVKAGIFMSPKLTSEYGGLNSWSAQDKELESLHTPEVLEMIRGHLTVVLSAFTYLTGNTSHISQVHVGLLYVASVVYGYFLRRVDQRFQLEKTVKLLPPSLNVAVDVQLDELFDTNQAGGQLWNIGSIIHSEILEAEVAALVASLSGAGKRMQGLHPSTDSLQAYIMSCDSETLRRYGTIRSKESMGIIEKHAEALVGRLPEIRILPNGSLVLASKDQMLGMNFSELRRLVLEAVTFGCFLWDVESYVDSHYSFVAP